MSTSNGIIVIFGLLCVSHLHNANAELKSTNQSYYYPEKHVLFNNYGMKDGNLVYAVCDDNQTDKITNLICTIVHRQFPYDKVVRSCNVTLQSTRAENNTIDRVVVQPIGQDNALLLWGELGSHSTFNLMAIQMNDCKTKMWQLNDPNLTMYNSQLYSHKILTYDNDFDIFIDSDAVMDGWADNQVGMRMSFDDEPQPLYDVIKKSKETQEKVMFMSPIATRSPAKGYVYIAIGEQGTSVVLAKPGGNKTLLSSDVKCSIMISANYDYITLCANPGTEPQISCTQYDKNGEIKFKVTIDHDKMEYIATVHTTPHGGFLLLTASSNENHNSVDFDVLRVDSEGKKMGSVRSIGLADRTYVKEILNVWENEDGYCTAFVRQSHSQLDNLQVDVDCFSENDFSM